MSDIYGYISYTFLIYIPYMHICFLDMFHVFSLVCFLIYGVKRRQVLIAKPHFYFYFSDFIPVIFLLVFVKIIGFTKRIYHVYSWLHKLRNTQGIIRGTYLGNIYAYM